MKKRILAAVLSAVTVFACCLLIQTDKVHAADTDSRVYAQVDQAFFEEYITAKKAPSKDGYLFAGWVARKSDGTGVAIRSKDDAVLSESGVTITAKFVPAHLAGVACQVKADTYKENVTQTELRIVSTVDNGVYQGFGFNLYERYLTDAETDTYTEYFYCGYQGEAGKNPGESTVRYSGMYAYENDQKILKTPVDLFGAQAEGFYFTTVRLGPIPQAIYDSSIFIIKPYWITADGTYVEGLGEFDRVSDGRNNIANISVNIKDAKNIAAGMLNVQYQSENYQFVSADFGRVFEEMKVETSGNEIRCVGNVADMQNNAQSPNDVYINLRFTKVGQGLSAGTSTFTVVNEGFCDKDEQDAAVTVGNVLY